MPDEPQKRKSSAYLRRIVVRRNEGEFCERCGHDLQRVHHIVPWGSTSDGTDDLDNLCGLCLPCHTEWHAFHEPNIPFRRFLDDALPTRVLSGFLKSEAPWNADYATLHRMWRGMRELLIAAAREEWAEAKRKTKPRGLEELKASEPKPIETPSLFES